MNIINQNISLFIKKNQIRISSDSILSDPDMMLRFSDEVQDIAKSILVKTEDEVSTKDWGLFKIVEDICILYIPVELEGEVLRLKHPFAWKCDPNPESYDYYVNSEVLGLICTMRAAKKIEAELILKRDRDRSLRTKLFGLSSRRLDTKIAFFKDIYNNLDNALRQHYELLISNDTIESKEKSSLDQAYNDILTMVHNPV